MASKITDANEVLIRGFRAWDGIRECEETLDSMIVSISDELELVAESLESEVPPIEVAARVVKRAIDRLRLALEIEPVQVREPVANENHFDVPPDAPFWMVPVDLDGEPQFEQAKRATVRDLNARGWILATEARKAVSVLIADQPAPTVIDNSIPEEPESGVIEVAESVEVAS